MANPEDQVALVKNFDAIHPATRALLNWFSYTHLPADKQRISKQFHDLAFALALDPALGGTELTVALRKLLEAKDAAVRASIHNPLESELLS